MRTIRKITDRQRVDFLERCIRSDVDGVVDLKYNDENRLPPKLRDQGRVGKPCEIFTDISQHQRGASVRDAIDAAMKFESRK